MTVRRLCALLENVGSGKKEVGGLRSSAKMLITSDANIGICVDAKVPVPTRERRLCGPPLLILLDTLHVHLMSINGRRTLRVMVTAMILQGE